MSNNGKKPTNREHAKQASLNGYNAVMASLISIIHALESFQDQLVQSVVGGKNVVSDEVYLQTVAKELLRHTQQALGNGGFMRQPTQAPKEPADAPAPEPAKPTLLTD